MLPVELALDLVLEVPVLVEDSSLAAADRDLGLECRMDSDFPDVPILAVPGRAAAELLADMELVAARPEDTAPAVADMAVLADS